MKKIILLVLLLNNICLSQTRITDFKSPADQYYFISLVAKFGNKVLFTRQGSITSVVSIWANTIGDTSLYKIGEFPDINYSVSGFSFREKPWFHAVKYDDNSEIWACDTNSLSLKKIFKFKERVNIFEYGNHLLASSQTQLLEIQTTDNGGINLKTIADTVSSIKVLETGHLVATNYYPQIKVIIIDSLLNKSIIYLTNNDISGIEEATPLDKQRVVIRTRDNQYNIVSYLHSPGQDPIRLQIPDIKNKIFQKFYFQNDTLKLIEVYGEERRYTLATSEIIGDRQYIKTTRDLKFSLGYNDFGQRLYSEFKVIDKKLFFLAYENDSLSLKTKDRYLMKFDLTTNNLEKFQVTEISDKPYPLSEYFLYPFKFQKEKNALKLYPASIDVPKVGLDLMQNHIIRFDSLSQRPFKNLPLSLNQFVYAHSGRLIFTDTLKRTGYILKPANSIAYISNIKSYRLVENNLFLIVGQSNYKHSIHIYDGKSLMNKYSLSDSIAGLNNFIVSEKLFGNKHLLFLNYYTTSGSYIAVFSYDTPGGQITLLYKKALLLFNSTIKIFTANGTKAFFSLNSSVSLVTDFTEAGTKVLLETNKTDDVQNICHVFPDGEVVISQKGNVYALKAPYDELKLLGEVQYSTNFLGYSNKFFFITQQKMYVYENESLRAVKNINIKSSASFTKLSDNEIMIYYDGGNLSYMNLDIEKLTPVYSGMNIEFPEFYKKLGDEYLIYIYNQPDYQKKTVAFNINTQKSRVVWAYKADEKISRLEDFANHAAWVSFDGYAIKACWKYHDGNVKKIEKKEISPLQYGQELYMYFNPEKKELSVCDISYAQGWTNITMPDEVVGMMLYKKFKNYYYLLLTEKVPDQIYQYRLALWITDGTKKNTVRLSEGYSGFSILTETSSKMYFTANEDETGNEVWETNGTIEGTKLTADIWKGSFSSFPGLMMINKTLYCFATTPEAGNQLWEITDIEDEKVLAKEYPEHRIPFKVFPNPTSDYLSIEGEGIGNANLQLVNVEGKVVFQKNISVDKSIILKDLPAGAYIVRVLTDKKSYVCKIIKI